MCINLAVDQHDPENLQYMIVAAVLSEIMESHVCYKQCQIIKYLVLQVIFD